MLIEIRIPEINQGIYLRGGCFAFAQELRKYVKSRSGVSLLLFAIWVDGEPEHVFLLDRDADSAYDARGRMPFDVHEISKGSSFEGIGTIAPISMMQMKAWARSMDGHNARMDIVRYVYVHDDEH